MKRLILFLSLVISLGLVSGSGSEKRRTNIDSTDSQFIQPLQQLRTGDIVLRSGKGFISDVFRSFSKEKKPWSHAGILVEKNGKFMVYHIMGNHQQNLDGIRVEALADFCNSRENNGYTVYRNNATSGNETAIRNHLQKLKKSNIRFDQKFNLDDDHFMYCTEMIYKTYLHSAHIDIPVSEFKGTPFVAIDDLIDPKIAYQVIEINY